MTKNTTYRFKNIAFKSYQLLLFRFVESFFIPSCDVTRGIELNIFWWQVYLGFPLRDNDPSKNIILPLTATSPLSQKEKKHLTMIFFLPFSMLLLYRHIFALLGQLFIILQSGNVRASQFYRVWFRKSPHTLLWMVPSYHCLPYRQRFIKKLLVAGIEPRLRVSKHMLEPLHHPL